MPDSEADGGNRRAAIENVQIGLVSGCFFLVSLFILVQNPKGLLNAPGIGVAVLGLVLVHRRFYALAATLGIMAASGSLVAQSWTAVCSSCTAAALAFSLAGIALLICTWHEHPFFMSSLAGILCGALVCFVFPGCLTQAYEQSKPTAALQQPENGGHTGTAYFEDAVGSAGKARLYVSLTCPACQKILPDFINNDPEGKHWVPVIVPSGFIDKGGKWLSEMGYRGDIEAQNQSPTGAVPLLIWNGGQYTGETEIVESPFFILLNGQLLSVGGEI